MDDVMDGDDALSLVFAFLCQYQRMVSLWVM
jgi:hypothetical protein